jgi:hypothetical protein
MQTTDVRMKTIAYGVVLLTAVVGCASEPTGGAARCEQTFEFANTGCGVLTGFVTDQNDVPIGGAHMSVQGTVDPGRALSLIFTPTQTSSLGTYSLHVIRDAGDALPAPDTVTVWVRAAVPPDSANGTPGPVDSVQATLEISPVGAEPVVVRAADIAIDLP